MRASAKHKKEVAAFGALFLLIFVLVLLLFLIDHRLFSNEVSSQFDDEKTFLEWYKKALEAYQSAAPLFSAWAASCIVAGYALIKELNHADKYVKTAIVTFVILFVSSIFDLYLSQAYFSYYTYVFDHDYPVFEKTITRHTTIQKYVHLLMLINVLSLAGISLIRKLK
jgi:hypothetical protein